MKGNAMGGTRLRVLLFTNLFPTPQEPTRGIFTWHLAQEIGELCDLTVICPLPWFPRWPILRTFRDWYAFAQVPTEYEFGGIKVHSPKYPMLPKVSEPLLGVLMLLGTFLAVWRLHRSRRFDLINAMWLYPDGVAASWIGKLLGIPLVPTALGCDVNLFLGETAKRGQILAMLRRSPAITAVSEELRERMVAEGIPAARIATTPNGVDADLFFVRDKTMARRELRLTPQERVIVFVGRLSEEKGLPTLIEAAHSLRRDGRDFKLYLVGDGPLLDSLRAKSGELGLDTSVRFVGREDHSRVPIWLAACDVFCLPSLREGCPNVVLESLSCGRPVVASRVGAIPDLVGADTGILVDSRNANQLAAALDRALGRRWDESRIAESVTGHSWRAAAVKYREAYDHALAEQKA
jgi:glycosyltransferase involved in cell wall biosynthesis